ncbi:uncharacterized protein B0H18DRAFT_444482 [Fomitopsis serialis]|uniref:uncharacterized protein n=1 Tax=Fomitopsis serialis TaxID=139415 RepID=UPI0020084B82|nr:uncharacterized protein B0H18DRAFT_444482 [Neoantrodia serialis]KAH9924038.1 hypothetical protein B0H18DRAFT_444482 [Neoantrodia serialis]
MNVFTEWPSTSTCYVLPRRVQPHSHIHLFYRPLTSSAANAQRPNSQLATIMSLSTLNEDVLRIIAEMLSSTECIPLSSVSRHLHAIARQYVFASITVGTMKQLVKMHDHLMRNIDNRRIWPRELTIYGLPGKVPYKAPAIDALVGIFEHAQELKALELHWCEAMIDCDARIGEHLAALSNLSDIRLLAVGPKTLDVLCKMVSRPDKAYLSSTMLFSNRALLRIAEAAVLGNVKRLRLHNCQFDARSELQLLSKLAGVYPRLEVLDLEGSAVYPCLILFPNIRRLTIVGGLYNLPPPGYPVEQRHLDYLSIEPTYLHLISAGPAIRSDYLRLYTERQRFDPSEVGPDLVSAAAVLELNLFSVECPTEFGMALAQMISAMVSRIRYLVLTTQWYSYSAVTRWMENITPSLSPSQLFCIRVHATHAVDRGPSRETWLELLQRLQSVHVSSVPSLRFYFQHVECLDDQRKPSGPSKTTSWRVEGNGDHRTVQPIPNWQGERIHRYMQSPEFCRTLQFDEGAALQYTGR